jgi:2-polyprenyl-3-methyl-5-hydroxy-6-metoxy-1,4-benzoquinol methylase
MVIQEDLHLCYPTDYMPYTYDPEMAYVDFESDNGGVREKLRNAVVKTVWGEPNGGICGAIGSFLAKNKKIRERAFYGLVLDECLPRSRGKDSALDVGCGAGWMLKRLAKVGWQVEGIEWNESAAEIARQRTGQKVWAGDFREIELPKEKYKLIYLSHVFEHFNDPLRALRRFYQLLSANGRLVMVFPNANSTDAHWFGADWFAWEVPRHLILSSPKSIFTLAKACGYVNARVRTRVADHLWTSSEAYRQERNPEQEHPDLSVLEKMGLLYQQSAVSMGSLVGSELIIILEKPGRK